MRWIKVGVDTPFKRALRNLAQDCQCSRGDAFLAWFNLYAWFDENTADGVIDADPFELDQKAGMAGVAASLQRSGWLSFNGCTCTIANWNEHNGQSAKRRAMNAKYQTECRERSRKSGAPVRPCPPIRPKRPPDFQT